MVTSGYIAALSAILLLAVVCYNQQTTVTYHGYYRATQQQFFNFISDPNNFKVLNPTILELSVGQCSEVELSVDYTEHLVQLPFILNHAHAKYYFNDQGPTWTISSHHITCFFFNLICVPTNSDVFVRAIQLGQVHYTEQITYNCPWLASKFCRQEVDQQRKLIMDKLAQVFGEVSNK